MSIIGQNILAGAAGAGGAYTIDQSCRFNESNDPKLSLTLSGAGDRKSWTYSCWFKPSTVDVTGDEVYMFSADDVGGSNGWSDHIKFLESTHQLIWIIIQSGGSSAEGELKTTQVFRDPSAWYHIVFVWDSANDTANDRMQIWLNGERITALATNNTPAEDYETLYYNNNGKDQVIGNAFDSSNNQYNGYLAEIYFIDGQSLDASSFGETNEFTNQWIPKDASDLTFGTNGFYFKFEDSADLGNDSSGNDNDFAVANLATDAKSPDSPTNNFCTWNPLANDAHASTFYEGNLKGTTSTYYGAGSTFILPTTGKWYVEGLAGSVIAANGLFFGIADPAVMFTVTKMYDNPTYCAVYRNDGLLIYTGGNNTTTDIASYVTGDIIGIAVDIDADEFWFAKNNTWQGVSSPNPSTGTAGHTLSTPAAVDWTFIFGSGDTNTEELIINCGQDSSFAANKTTGSAEAADGNGIGDFYYAPPTAFLALCTSNLPDPSIKLPGEHFNTLLYDDGAGAKTGLGFQPDVVWVKARGAANDNKLTDSLRGVEEALTTNTTAAETTYAQGLLAFGADGFTVGTDDHFDSTVGSGMASWSWKAATTFDPATDGDITVASGQSNATAGFSIVRYTGENAINTIGHGLPTAPKLIIVKNLGVVQWPTFYNRGDGTDGIIFLDQSGAGSNAGTAYWNDTNPTASVFTVGAANDTGGLTSPDYIAYCFAEVEGYSKIGLYEGNNNADGTFIYTGFRPAWFMIKNTDSTEPWMISDNKRSTYNLVTRDLQPSTGNAEATGSLSIDYVSNGFKLRSNNATMNTSHTFLYVAIAESSFKTANAR